MITKQKGMIDITGETSKKWIYLNDAIRSVFEKYNYEFIRTPILEASELFHRGVGETSDIVTKETYDFKDRGDREVTLRPEGTAGVVRAYIENKMYGDAIQPKKLYYTGTMYRYERPQTGRLRELTQYGCEVLGSDDPAIDAEVISIPVSLFKLLGLKNVRVGINSLGDAKTRNDYHNALKEYFKEDIKNMCEDCQKRYDKNPLRILDCKVDGEKEIIKNAPKITDYLSTEAKERFETVQKYLDLMGIEYEVDTNIVRGLDYYDHTVFEVMADIPGMGAQNVLCGGGRYNKLVSTLGGPETPAMGFGGGLDRLLLAVESSDIKLDINNGIDAYIMYVSEDEKDYAVSLNLALRMNGFTSDMEYMSRNLKGQFKQADRFNAKFLIILNSEDIAQGKIKIKDNATKEEQLVSEADLIDFLDMNM
ncbi:MAG: histidine--tRNA ligase [Firmicutes bacterium]|jgi:histidyl-tRNA synthetase|nr:histidine--tRNA ligase [Bacillota bacterium]